MTATVVIVTKNRKDELAVALRSASKQTAQPEILVVDDGSTDGTADMVRSQFPGVRLIRHEQSGGYICRRNEGAREAGGTILFSIDDDAEFVSPRTVEQTLREFDEARVGAVAIPCLEPNKGNPEFQRAPDPNGVWITDCYIGTSHAVRRDVFNRLGGYREGLIHQGEERDYCLRLLQAGYVVRLGNADAIHHYESPRRDWSRMDYYGRRNDIRFAWDLVPMPFLIAHLAGTTVNAVRSALRAGRYAAMFRGTMAGYADCFRLAGERAPVSRSLYQLHRRLKKRGPLPLECLSF